MADTTLDARPIVDTTAPDALATGKRPLFPTLEALANNTSKARAACVSLRRHDSRVRIVPFEPDGGEIAVIEVYPALWKKRRKGHDELVPRGAEIMQRREVTDPEKDAYPCALTAACYERTFRCPGPTYAQSLDGLAGACRRR